MYTKYTKIYKKYTKYTNSPWCLLFCWVNKMYSYSLLRWRKQYNPCWQTIPSLRQSTLSFLTWFLYAPLFPCVTTTAVLLLHYSRYVANINGILSLVENAGVILKNTQNRIQIAHLEGWSSGIVTFQTDNDLGEYEQRPMQHTHQLVRNQHWNCVVKFVSVLCPLSKFLLGGGGT